jgi:Protein of unknown function (DUF2795)
VTQRAAELQGLLEGIALPAGRDELIAYARGQDASAARDLSSLPDREYRSLDEVGEALSPVQPQSPSSPPPTPHEESDLPPGGDAYTDPNPDTGAVRHDAPPYNPPQKAIEEQSKTLKQQQERQQKQLG